MLRTALASGEIAPVDVARDALARANGNASRNTYLFLDRESVIDEAEQVRKGPLSGVPISLKDCFDLAGALTTFGTRFYAERNPVAQKDSAVAARLRESGALITGKTHLHPLAYGITGQNPDFGDSLQPRDASLLTGGSSSGAAASVQEGSALAAVGTDTGGSIRVPAALCGLTGYRASHNLAAAGGAWPEMWRGAWALAPSFDTLGLIFRDPRDAAPLAEAVFHLPVTKPDSAPRIGCVPLSFLHDASAEVREGYIEWQRELRHRGARLDEFAAARWAGATEIFTGIQAYEAARIHAGCFDAFGPLIAQRLRWGDSLGEERLQELRGRHDDFRAGLARLFADFDFLMLPCAHVAQLGAAEDHATTRSTILRYTAPFSLGGLPSLALPGELIGASAGTGVQLAAAEGRDAALLAYATEIGDRLAGR